MSDKFTYKLIGLAMQVHSELGPGLDESFYHDLFSCCLKISGMAHHSRARGRLLHKGILADEFEADLLMPEQCIAELKCLQGGFAPEHYVQLICYLKYWNVPTGLLFDFGKESLAYRRVNLPDQPEVAFEPEHFAARSPGRTLAQAITNILREHGLGYRDTTYRGLLLADLKAQGIACEAFPEVTVTCGKLARAARCDCLLIENELCVTILALRKRISAADIAITRNYALRLGASAAVVLNFGKSAFESEWIKNLNLCPPQIFGRQNA